MVTVSLASPFVLLENRLNRDQPAVFYHDMTDLVACSAATEVSSSLAHIERGLGRGLHAAGVFSYELGHALETRLLSKLPPARSAPLFQVGLFRRRSEIGASELDDYFATLGPPQPIRALRTGHSRKVHIDKVRQILDYISAGDIYQANLTFPMHLRYTGDPLSLYGALRVRQPTAHAAFVSLGDSWVLSVSPELFLRVQGGNAVSRPMKGTVARGIDDRSDRQAVASLRADPKQRAENLMIVDLIRNDLARVSRAGSVRVPEYLTVETYPDLHTLTSTVTGELLSDVTPAKLLQAMFPCGSIVGAPKIRAAEILSELEGCDRGVYTGAIGAFGPSGDAHLNVAIRTLVLQPDGCGVYGVGGGIVADSDPNGEYDEALLKARLLEDLARDFELIETFRWTKAGGFLRLALHLGRLGGSAASLGFAFDAALAAAELSALDALWRRDASGDRRVRLLLSRDGKIGVSSMEVAPASSGTMRLMVAKGRLDTGDPYLRHKTSRREVYDRAAAEAQRAGVDEALLLNRAGDLADGSRHTLFCKFGDHLLTPPIAAGALPGVLRGCLIAEGKASEEALSFDDLRGAEALFVGNSLNGLRGAVLS